MAGKNKRMQSMSKKKPAVPAEIPQDLQEKMNALKGTATTFNMLDKGHYPHSFAEAVRLSMEFVKSLHAQIKEDCLAHPQAHLVPELKKALDELKKTKKAAAPAVENKE